MWEIFRRIYDPTKKYSEFSRTVDTLVPVKISFIFDVIKTLHDRVVRYEKGYDYRELLYHSLKFDKPTRSHYQLRLYDWEMEILPLCIEKYRFEPILTYRKITDVTAMMLCSKCFYGITDGLTEHLNDRSDFKNYVIIRFKVDKFYIHMQMAKKINHLVIILYILDNDEDVTHLNIPGVNGYADISGNIVDSLDKCKRTQTITFVPNSSTNSDTKPVKEDKPVNKELNIKYAVATSAHAHIKEDRKISLRRAFHMLVYFYHAKMIGTKSNIPVLHIQTERPKEDTESYSVDKIHISINDGIDIENMDDPSKIPYKKHMATAVRRADSIFPTIKIVD
jgi:hypothetical protein